jgi:hypothetical protein
MTSKPSNQTIEDQRNVLRRRVDEPATIKHERGTEKGLVRDISSSGAQLVLQKPPAPNSTVEIRMEAVGSVTAKVKWSNGDRVGAEFEDVAPDTVEKIKRL